MNGMNQHANGSAEWHREQLGIKTPEQKRIERLEEHLKRHVRRIAELEAELAECKRDAERYQWLREYWINEDFDMILYPVNNAKTIDQLDSAIDSAISALKGEGK